MQIPPKKQLAVPSPIIFMKARKNRIEIGGMREAHIRDAVALCDFLAYLEEAVSMILSHLFTALCFYKTQISIEPSVHRSLLLILVS